jgi:hypothetical protein
MVAIRQGVAIGLLIAINGAGWPVQRQVAKNDVTGYTLGLTSYFS